MAGGYMRCIVFFSLPCMFELFYIKNYEMLFKGNKMAIWEDSYLHKGIVEEFTEY